MNTPVPPGMQPRRRRLLALAGGLALPWPALRAQPGTALEPRALVFPRDHGAHSDTRTEWWYLTGSAQDASGRDFGFQLTFFRSRVDATRHMKSRLAAKQLLFAHAAVTDVETRQNWHDQRIARWNGEAHPLPQSPAAVFANQGDTHVVLRDWHLQRDARGRYTTQLKAADFGFKLSATPTQALLLQGDNGFSRKGPELAQASFYYSQPQLVVQGEIRLQGQTMAVSGKAWLDHEWSEAILHPEAVGWDWIGMNLFDGTSLTVFQLRRQDGSKLWAGGSFRAAAGSNGPAEGGRFAPGDVDWSPRRFWKSPLTQASYPVEWLVRTPVDSYTVKAVIDPQELDSRRSTGTVYWEGLSDLFNSNGQHVGRGYLEMTGYAQRLVL